LERTLEELPARGNQHYLAHEELVVACPKEQAEEVADFLEEVMVVGRDKIVNPGLDADHPERVHV
jgi:hypothetical protein